MKFLSFGIVALAIAAFCYFFFLEEPSTKSFPDINLTSYPLEIDKECRDGRAKIFDECSDQLELYLTAQKRAKDDGKVLLVSYGAEWCIWCHVFEKYIRGDHVAFTHTYSDEEDEERYTETMYERENGDVSDDASRLAQFVADNFVVVHIEYKYSGQSEAALEASGADQQYDDNLPFIYTVNADGRFSKAFEKSGTETRRDTYDWYRGYDRKKLLMQLRDMRDEALVN